MEKENVSPEERLFKVIQESKKSSPDIEDLQKKMIVEALQKKKIRIDIRGITQFFANLKSKAKAVKNPGNAEASLPLPIGLYGLEPKVINRILFVILSFLAILVIHSSTSKRLGVEKITDAISKLEFQVITKKAIETFKPVAFYREEIKKRDIFRPSPRTQQKVAVAAPEAKRAQAKLKEMVKDLKIVGISWGKSPKVMIKSRREKNTYFLRQGQMIGATGIKVKTILRDKVVISYQGEEMEFL